MNQWLQIKMLDFKLSNTCFIPTRYFFFFFIKYKLSPLQNFFEAFLELSKPKISKFAHTTVNVLFYFYLNRTNKYKISFTVQKNLFQ